MVLFSLIASLIYILSILFSSLIQQNLNIVALKIVGAIILILLGIYKISDPLIKKTIKKHPHGKRYINFRFNNFQIMINIYVDPRDADINHSQSLSFKETVLLSITMNIDSLLSGLMIDNKINSWYLVGILSFAINMIFLMVGYWLGRKIGTSKNKDYSYLCGFLLIFLGIKVLL